MGGGHRQNSGAGRWPAGSAHRLRRNPYAYCPFLSGQDSLWLKRRMRAYRRFSRAAVDRRRYTAYGQWCMSNKRRICERR